MGTFPPCPRIGFPVPTSFLGQIFPSTSPVRAGGFGAALPRSSGAGGHSEPCGWSTSLPAPLFSPGRGQKTLHTLPSLFSTTTAHQHQACPCSGHWGWEFDGVWGRRHHPTAHPAARTRGLPAPGRSPHSTKPPLSSQHVVGHPQNHRIFPCHSTRKPGEPQGQHLMAEHLLCPHGHKVLRDSSTPPAPHTHSHCPEG